MFSEQTKRDALSAVRLMEDPFLTRILDEMEQGCVEEWKDSSNPERREYAWYRLKAVLAFRSALHGKLVTAQFDSHGKDEEINAALSRTKRSKQ